VDATALIGSEFFGAFIDKHALESEPADFVYYKLRGGSIGFEDVERIASKSPVAKL